MSSDYLPDWDSFYSRTIVLPKPELTKDFLINIAKNGAILDFGTGSGRWASAFLRDRADLIIDVLDQNIDKATLLENDWCGEKIKSSFQEFTPSKKYDGIWSYASLFFLNNDELKVCFHKLVTSLNDGGIISFSMVDDSDSAQTAKFHGLSKDSILDLLSSEALETVSFDMRENTQYGKGKISIPTYFVTARKPYSS